MATADELRIAKIAAGNEMAAALFALSAAHTTYCSAKKKYNRVIEWIKEMEAKDAA